MKTESVAVRPAKINLFSFSIAIILLLLLLPRPLTYFGLPFFVNFMHYPFVLVLYLTTILFPGRTYDRFFPGLTILLIAIAMSALLNGAGAINVILDFLLLSEPFMILALMTGSLWNPAWTHKLVRIILFLMFLHLIFAYTQFLFLTSNPDDVKGLFIAMGAGHHVGGAVALTAAVYFLITSPPKSVIMRLVFPFFLAIIVIISDSKQVVLVFGLSLGVMGFLAAEYLVAFKATQAFQLIKFTIIPAAVILIILPFAIPLATIERFMSDLLVGFEHKISVFPMLWSFHESSLNAVFGLGPGHTIGRLAQMLPRYWDLLAGLDATRRPFTAMIVYADYSFWLTADSPRGTSLYSMQYSWPGIWGDLGFAGIVSYGAIWVLVWKRICRDLLSKFFVCNMLIFGMVFSWLEEPGYMGVVAILIGLRWQAVGRREIEEHERSTRPYFHGKTLDGGIRPSR